MSYADQPIGFGDRKPRELPPAGWHECALTGIYNVGRQYDEYNSVKTGQAVWKTIIKLKFESANKRPDGKNVLIYHEVTGSMDSRAHLRALVHQIEGKDLTDKEAAAYRLSSALGRPVMINIAHVPKKTNPSEMKMKINAIVPSISPHTPEQEPEIWDWRGSDPDDAPDWVWDLYRKSKDFKEPAKPRVPKPRGEFAQAVVAASPSMGGYTNVPEASAKAYSDAARLPTASTAMAGIEDPPF